MTDISSKDLLQRVSSLLNEARQKVVHSVNQTMVLTYFEIGRMIVEEEQNGKERADYGKQIIKMLSLRLTQEFGKGFSQRNLEQMRQFYLVYSKTQTLSAELEDYAIRDVSISASRICKIKRMSKKPELSH